MKTKILLGLLFIASVSSCDESTEQITVKSKQSTVIATSLAEEPFLNEVLSSAGFESNSRDQHSRINSEGVSVQVDEILKVIQDDSSHYTYTFGLQYHSTGFSNLILEETPDGNYLAFILTYEFEGAFDLLNYSGRILRLDLDGNALGELAFQDGELITDSDSHAKAMQASTCLTGATKHEECMEWGSYKNALGTQETCLRKALVITLEYGDCSSYTPAQPDEPAPTFGGGTTISGPGNGSSGSTQPADIDSGTGIKPIPGYKPSKPVVVIPERWEDQIDDTGLKPCMKAILSDLKNLKNGSIGQIIQKFSGDTPGYNWVMKDSTLQGQTGSTSPPAKYNKEKQTITTKFDSQAWKNATDLSWARTILHESIHAYLSVYFAKNRKGLSSSYPQMVQDWGKFNNWESVHHEEFARSLVNEIANSLEEFGKTRGYDLPHQFYEEMSWGGLQDTNIFNSLPEADKTRIRNTNIKELTKQDLNGDASTQKGKNAGC